MEFLRNKKVIVGIVLVAVAFFVYAFFFAPTEDSRTTLSTSRPSGAQFAPGQEIIILLTDLKSIQLDPEVFSNPSFRSLVDFTIPLEPEPQGRNNPFAPLGTDSTPFVVEEETTVSEEETPTEGIDIETNSI